MLPERVCASKALTVPCMAPSLAPGRHSARRARVGHTGRCGGRDLLTGDEVLEVGAGLELGHRRRGDVNGVARSRVTGRASGPVGLFERTETGDGDLLTLGHGRLDRVQDGVHGFGGGLLAAEPLGDRVYQITLVHEYSSGSPLARTKLDRKSVV